MNNFLLLTSNASVLLWFLLGWLFFWKGLALWKAASKRQFLWFLIFLFLNTLGILEILYLFWLGRWNLIDNEKILKQLREKIGNKFRTI